MDKLFTDLGFPNWREIDIETLLLENEAVYEALYEYFLPEMPPGTANGKDDDPYDFIVYRVMSK